MWAAVPVLEPEPRGWVGKNMSLSIKGIFVVPRGAFHVENMERRSIKRQGTKPGPFQSKGSMCLPCLLYTIRDVKELVRTLVSNNNDHDIYSVEYGPKHSGITHACQSPYISLLIIPCIIYHVTNKETLNLYIRTYIFTVIFWSIVMKQALTYIFKVYHSKDALT